MRRRLRERGLRFYRLLRKPLLSQKNIKARLHWAENNVLYREAQWDRIVWSDESRFCLRVCDGRARVWRERGKKRYDRSSLVETVTGFGGSVHVWAAIWTTGRSELEILESTVTGDSYVKTLEKFLRNSTPPAGWRFQDDNARPHRAKVVSTFKEINNIRTIDWPAQSPDLNPIENVWDYIGRKLHSDLPENLNKLKLKLREIWKNMPQDFIVTLIRSMNRRISAVITARGLHTRY